MPPAPSARTTRRRRSRPRAPTPVMEQYIEIKTANPDSLLFYRMGDFYELFFEDAEVASRALGIVLTKRGKHLGRDIPMCGVPVVRAEEYLHRLIALGHRVAVCEQTEDPAEAKQARLEIRGAARRGAAGHARHAHRGHAARRAPQQLSARGGSHAPARRRRARTARFALAWIDISTGEFRVGECAAGALSAEIARIEPGEIDRFRRAVRRAGAARRSGASCRRSRRSPATCSTAPPPSAGCRTISRSRPPMPSARCRGSELQRRRRLRHLCGAHPDRPAPAALAAAARGAGRDAGDRPGHARQSRTGALARRRAARHPARRRRPHGHGRRLAAAGAAARGAADRSRRPSRSRLDSVDAFVADAGLRGELRARLKAAPDLARALSRIVLGRGGPRDLAAVRDGIAAAAAAGGRLRRPAGRRRRGAGRRRPLRCAGPIPRSAASFPRRSPTSCR